MKIKSSIEKYKELGLLKGLEREISYAKKSNDGKYFQELKNQCLIYKKLLKIIKDTIPIVPNSFKHNTHIYTIPNIDVSKEDTEQFSNLALDLYVRNIIHNKHQSLTTYSSNSITEIAEGKNISIENLDGFIKYTEELNKIIKYIHKQKFNDDDLILVKLKSGKLSLSKNTGVIILNQTKDNLNPNSQEFRTVLKLMENKDNKATYQELIGGTPTKPNKRNLAFVIRNVKRTLRILPQKSSKNKNIIKNIKNHGYGLIT